MSFLLLHRSLWCLEGSTVKADTPILMNPAQLPIPTTVPQTLHPPGPRELTSYPETAATLNT